MKSPFLLNPSSVVAPRGSAFKVPAINVRAETCNSSCLSEAAKVLDRSAIQAINRTVVEGKSAEAVGSVLGAVPAVSASLQNKGIPVAQAKTANNALVAAITQSVKENWEKETQDNVIEFANALALDPVSNQEKLAQVKKNCL